MFSFEEAGSVLDSLVEELPDGIFRDLNGGVCLIEDSVRSDDGRFTLGTYYRNEMGRYVELYYGSFVELYGSMDDELFTERLRKTLHHELTHHVESMAGDRSLERWDERQSELCGFNGIAVESVLFVCGDNAALSPAAEAMFRTLGGGAYGCASAASCDAASCVNARAVKACAALGIDISAHEPVAVTREILERSSVALCMTINDAEALSSKFQDLDERIMCLGDDDITLPILPTGWKKCMERLKDEVLTVIDELNQENF